MGKLKLDHVGAAAILPGTPRRAPMSQNGMASTGIDKGD